MIHAFGIAPSPPSPDGEGVDPVHSAMTWPSRRSLKRRCGSGLKTFKKPVQTETVGSIISGTESQNGNFRLKGLRAPAYLPRTRRRLMPQITVTVVDHTDSPQLVPL